MIDLSCVLMCLIWTWISGLTTQEKLPGDHKETSFHSTTSTTSTSLPVDSITPMTYIKSYSNEQYYNMTIMYDSSHAYWDEMYNHTKHGYLFGGVHFRSVPIPLSFTMPFYGHKINKVLLTTGGFIYMSPFVHNSLTYSQYVAPLMANFDTKGNNSEILYKEYENSSIVFEWRNVQLNKERNHGQFTFQVKLYHNGTIIFVYKTVPMYVGDISASSHAVKQGLSDAYYEDHEHAGLKRRTIIMYNTIEINDTLITDSTVVLLDPLPTCNSFTDCNQCVSQQTDFICFWCDKLSRCSDGLDWKFQEWRDSGCNETGGNTSSICNTIAPISLPTTTKTSSLATTTSHGAALTYTPTVTKNTSNPTIIARQEHKSEANELTVIIPITSVFVLLIGVVGIWIYYAYTHPNTRSGKLLIEYRPSQLKRKLLGMSKRHSRKTGGKYRKTNEEVEIEINDSAILM